MANSRYPALELVNNVNRNDVDISGPIRPESDFKTSLIGQGIFTFQTTWPIRYTPNWIF